MWLSKFRMPFNQVTESNTEEGDLYELHTPQKRTHGQIEYAKITLPRHFQ